VELVLPQDRSKCSCVADIYKKNHGRERKTGSISIRGQIGSACISIRGQIGSACISIRGQIGSTYLSSNYRPMESIKVTNPGHQIF